MTTADAGSVAQQSAASAGTPDTQNAGADNGSAAAAASPFAGLQDEGTRKWVETKGYKSVEDLAKAAVNQESIIGSSVRRPADDAPAAEWDKFYSKIGRPEKPDAYELKRPDGLPADLPYDEALAGSFKTWAHQAGLNGKQAQSLHDAFALAQAEQAKAHVTALTKAVETTADALAKEWGPQDSETFKAKHELANRALKKLGLVESFKKSGIILNDGALTDPALAVAFSQIGEKMFAEDTIDGEGGQGGPNPFKGEKNLTQITALVKSDPDKARRLAREAGVDPDHWVPRR
ncbi:hypothetical protein [Bradyrhizobium japonicum]|uniref:hypothetical protein n=1 Tax=Bradyrhizobium japonicum TaxID=375 RepID=UPI0004627614|nr:hypothetical protein [Bradyrhizobium japonicum]